MLYSFGALIAIVIIAHVGIAVSLFVFKESAFDAVHEAMEEGMKKYKVPGSEGVTQVWDILQRDLKCCGVINATDWNGKPFQDKNCNAPDSCCTLEFTGCGQDQLKPCDVERVRFELIESRKDPLDKRLNDAGCLKVIESQLEDRKVIVIVAGVSAILLQIVALIGFIN